MLKTTKKVILLIRKLMDLSTSKQGEGGVDSESHKAELELKNSKKLAKN